MLMIRGGYGKIRHFSASSTINMSNNSARKRQLSPSTMHANSREAQYAVRGAVALKAMSIQKKLSSPEGSSLPFKSLISCNIGNPQALGQKPLTFIRQVAAACTYPALMETPGLFPDDVISRARAYLSNTDRGFGVGAYTDSHGLSLVRDEVARFISERDGFPCNPADIALTTGASEGVRRVIQALMANPSDGLMISAPQYPLYACSITMSGGEIVFYNLDESNKWTINTEELERSFEEASSRGVNVRGLVVINPGNPVGAVLSKDVIKSIITFASERNLLIFADEVYQGNIYSDSKKFHSFKKCLRELQRDHPNSVYETQQLVSFHTVSKGLIGECGQRGGYVEYVGFSEAMMLQFRKLAASTLSSNTVGQIIVGLMVNPPKLGEASYPLYSAETSAIYDSLKRRADKLFKRMNELEGVSCQPIEGAMYAFPTITLPPAAVEEAAKRGIAADEMYCLDMVEEAGIVTVPGSGFGQMDGTYHFRITILPSEDEIEQVIERLGKFHANWLKRYGGLVAENRRVQNGDAAMAV